MDYKKDYYIILEIPQSASREDIRAAYRRLAKLYHPDKNAGNAAEEEKFKLINKANEILSNEILKHEYDTYRAEQQRWEKMQAEKDAGNEEVKQANKKTYTKTNTIVTETRIYIRGEITVKYWANCKEQMAASYDKVLDYKITPTEATVKISEENIFPTQEIPLDYLRAYKESEIFAMPIPQPIRCEVTAGSGKQYYELRISDIKIKNIKLKGITKHENKSYGTLTGQFYGYSPKLTYEEIEEIVTECFGETGKTEKKEEDGFTFIRKQYYYPDCSTYWGNWIRLPKATARKPAPKRAASFTNNYTYTEPGCGIIAWIIALLAMLFLFPKFFIVCLLLTALALLIHYGGTIFSSVGRFLSFLGVGLFLLFLITAVRSIYDHQNSNYIKKKELPRSAKTIRKASLRSSPADTSTIQADSLITHFVQWQDYAGKTYQGNFTISVAALQNATATHRQMSESFYQDISEVYKTMLDHDSARLSYLYQTFDSIKAANSLDEIAFAQVMVSAIQSQPYYLVVDKSCNDNYSDDFTRNYLANCKTDCCIGNEFYGVRSPVEFLSDLKGDCDTRSLLLYQLLQHYNYNVALLTSSYYKHAMIAVSLASTDQDGLSITVDDKKFFLWEITSPDLNYGNIPPGYSDLSRWDISLINKKIQYETDSEHL